MLNIIRLLSAFFLLSLSLVSCRDTDLNGDLLQGFNYNENTIGDNRYLYQEVTSSDTLAQYQYMGKKLTLITGKGYRTDISYSGDKVSTITHNATLANGDNIKLTQDFVYNILGTNTLDKIIEKKQITIPATTPNGSPTIKNYHTTYDLTYNTQNKITNILQKSGEVIVGASFSANEYTKFSFIYHSNSENIAQNAMEKGSINANILSSPTSTESFEYTEYDAQKSPYSLLPMEYLLHRLFLNNGTEAHIFSQQNPKKYTHSGSNIPVPQTYTNTELIYDADNYLKAGWQRMFEYKPF